MAVIPLDELTHAVTRITRAHHHINTYTAPEIRSAYTTIQVVRQTTTGALRRWLDSFTLTSLTARTTGDLDDAITTLADHLRIGTPCDISGGSQLGLALINTPPDQLGRSTSRDQSRPTRRAWPAPLGAAATPGPNRRAAAGH